MSNKESGRPTKYKEEYCEQVIEFFNREPYEPIVIQDEDGNDTVATDKFGNPILKPCLFPTKEGFASHIGVHRETLINWAKAHPSFFDAIKMAEQLQFNILVQNSLVKTYDKTFAIFTAKNVMGWTDKGNSDYCPVEITGKTASEKCESIINKAALGEIPLDKAQSYLSMYTSMLRIDEVTELKTQMSEIKTMLGLSDE